MKYTNKDAKIRMYDGGTPTPWYFEMCLDNGDLSAPLDSAPHERTLILSRGKFTTCSHYVVGNDYAPMEPVDISFTVMVNDSDKYLNLMDWIEGATNVNGHPILSTKGSHPRLTSTGIFFRDTSKRTVDIEYLVAGTDGTSVLYYWNEVYFDLGTLTMSEAEDGVNISFAGKCYGTIGTQATWTPGNDVNVA